MLIDSALDLIFYESVKGVSMTCIPGFSRDCRLEFKSYDMMNIFMRLLSSTYKIQSLGAGKLVTIDHSGAYEISSITPSMAKMEGNMVLLSCTPREHLDLFIVR